MVYYFVMSQASAPKQNPAELLASLPTSGAHGPASGVMGPAPTTGAPEGVDRAALAKAREKKRKKIEDSLGVPPGEL